MSAIVEMPVTMTSLELVDFINDHRKRQAEAAGVNFPSSEFAKLRHDSFMEKAPKVLGDGVQKFLDTYRNAQNGQDYPCYRFPKRESCLMAMSYSYELQAAVFDHMTALESKLNQQAAATLPTYSEALRQLADQIDENTRISAERDHAIATKALIGGKREATAMATASAATKKARQLEQELGRGTQHATIIAVENATGLSFGNQGFRPLQKWCKAHDVTPPKVPCPRFGKAVSWPADAWLEVYGVDLGELFGAEVIA
ncbi:Rha family transcriptional regulator [Azotobacter beijerinckii]|uniref:hypothetical protein n=1 Tax=Azotobacter beijerinckii TaxID=170623 RepID=UPI002954532A|nr:hypothetical protein [Azotobacter beijerinckii]MDV7210759.1 hypothetical protein [Azotobacter beijerinckii]